MVMTSISALTCGRICTCQSEEGYFSGKKLILFLEHHKLGHEIIGNSNILQDQWKLLAHLITVLGANHLWLHSVYLTGEEGE